MVYLLENISLRLKALVFMLRSWCFYSQSSGYKSQLKDRWHTCSPQTARDRAGLRSLGVRLKFNNLCCHLDPALQFGWDLPTRVHVPFSKVHQFCLPCLWYPSPARVSCAVCVFRWIPYSRTQGILVAGVESSVVLCTADTFCVTVFAL